MVFLRVVGVINAALWLGAAAFLALAAEPGFFSPEMTHTLTPPYNAAAAGVIVRRYFLFHHWCASIAILHLLAEWLYMGRVLERVTLFMLAGFFCIGLAGHFWLHPRMKQAYVRQAYGATQEIRLQAQKSFHAWRGVSRTLEFLMVGGLVFYLLRVSSHAQPMRSVTYHKTPIVWR